MTVLTSESSRTRSDRTEQAPGYVKADLEDDRKHGGRREREGRDGDGLGNGSGKCDMMGKVLRHGLRVRHAESRLETMRHAGE